VPSVAIAGGGLAGLAAAAALSDAGFMVDLYEARGFLGGRATSFPLSSSDSETIDNCQHVLMRCFTNLLDLYRRLGVEDRIEFHRRFHFLEPGGRMSVLQRGVLPAPLHFLGSFAKLQFLGPFEKLALARALAALKRERETRDDLDRITMLDWLREKRQGARAISRFWGQVLVSAINEDLDRMAARHGFQVFWQAFLADAAAHEMGLAKCRLGELYNAGRLKNVRVHLRTPVERFWIVNGAAAGVVAGGERVRADYSICALPFERAPSAAPELRLDPCALEHSPITGIHLWFDRPVMALPHAVLLDRTIQWAFNKSEGRYIQVVVSASRQLLETPRVDVIALAVRELGEFFPRVKQARVDKAHAIKEARATFSARPGAEKARPPARTAIHNLFLAGDWTRTGWPATMEGAVRSGYLAAEAAAQAAGCPQTFVR
jgi:squalene-associated FAD-dependent desaturase